MLAMQYQFDRSQWWPRERLVEQQFRQLRQLASHAIASCPHYRDHLAAADLDSVSEITPQTYLRWPVLRRREVQDRQAELRAETYPGEHGSATETFTSGSTGEPTRVLTSEIAQFFAHALVLRDHLWQRRDFGAKFVAIRFLAKEASQPGWSAITNSVFATGPAAQLDVATDVSSQLDWLIRQKPAYLLTTPSNLGALIDRSRDTGRVPFGLREVVTYAEALPAELRERVRELWQARLVDTYSCREFGAIALQCPEAAHYHVQSENLYVEILREDGKPCETGEAGRVVVTALHNFPMPLLRYELGDIAEAGETCPCGRGLPVIRRIAGRVRNMACDPSGRRFQPAVDPALKQAGVAIRQFQLVQHSPGAIEMVYVLERELSVAEAQRLRSALAELLGYPFEISFSRAATIERSPGGKYESFVSRIAG